MTETFQMLKIALNDIKFYTTLPGGAIFKLLSYAGVGIRINKKIRSMISFKLYIFNLILDNE